MAVPSQRTLPHVRGDKISVRALHAEVVSGPAAGESASGERIDVGIADGNDLVLRGDETVSRFHLALERREEGILIEDRGSTNGTWLGKVRLEKVVVPPGTEIDVGRSRIRVSDGDEVSVEVLEDEHLGRLLGRSAQMRRLMAKVRRAALSEVAVLLQGESGTGKEVIATSLHELGPRHKGPFVVVDCGSLSPTLVASELFGHEKGAFTGADHRHVGAFERAAGGTILLDEVGELPESLQPTLLGVLERRRFRRLGGRDEVPVDARVVAATHRDLRAEVNAGRFRLDLFYRLAVVRLEVAPLRERPEDIEIFAEHFAREAGFTDPLESLLDPGVLDTFRRYPWPGNVRELRNAVEATLAMGEAPRLEDHASLPPGASPFAALLHQTYKEARATVLHQFEGEYLPALVSRAEGNVSQAARDAKMDRSHLWELLRRHGLR